MIQIILGLFIAQVLILCAMLESAIIKDFRPFYNGWGTPKYIYKNTNCNMFGCILITLLGVVLIPIYYIIYFIYFIFHIGRK
jgi:hypothetical protein